MSLNNDDKSLVEQAKNGSKEAFTLLIQQNQTKIYNLCYRMTGNPQDALDTSQEAFLKAWQALPNFKGDSSFSSWLYRLATNASIDLLRKQNRNPSHSLTTQWEDEDEGCELQIPDNTNSPAKTLDQKVIASFIEKGLSLLPPHQKNVLIMREVHGLSYQEISQTLNLDLGTVKSRIARGRLSLRKYLQKEGITPES